MSYMATYGGEKVSLATDSEMPSLNTIGISLSRLVRFAGHQEGVYSVLAHSLTVAELMPPGEEIFGLMHDAQESLTSDVPRPMKCEQHSAIEDALYERICRAHGVPHPYPKGVYARVRVNDNKALVAEATIIGYSSAMHDWFREEELVPDDEALAITRRHARKVQRWMFADDPQVTGRVFERAFRKYMKTAGLA